MESKTLYNGKQIMKYQTNLIRYYYVDFSWAFNDYMWNVRRSLTSHGMIDDINRSIWDSKEYAKVES